MKTILLFAFIAWGLNGMSQSQDSIRIQDNWYKRDTPSLKDSLPAGDEMKIIPSRQENANVRILSGSTGSTSSQKTGKTKRDYPFRGHLKSFDFGFVNLDQSDYSMYPPEQKGFMDLNFAKSFVMQFNFLEESVRLCPRGNFGLDLGFGLQYQNLRFDNKRVSIQQDKNDRVVPLELDSNWTVKRNSFKLLYLSIPVMLEYQIPVGIGDHLYIAAGAVGNFHLHSRTKIIYYDSEGEKKKSRNKDYSYSLMPVKLDLVTKIGYNSWNIWTSYTVTDMFRNKKGPDLHPYSIGIGYAFY